MYTATKTSITKEDTKPLPMLVVVVQYYKDGVEFNPIGLLPIRTSNINDIDNLIFAQIATFEKIDANNALADNPNVGPVIKPTSPPKTDKDIFFDNLNKLEQYKKFLPADDKNLTELQALVLSQFKSEYFG